MDITLNLSDPVVILGSLFFFCCFMAGGFFAVEITKIIKVSTY